MDSWDLKKWRKKHGFNQFEAAEKLGINRGSFQNWEREVRPITKIVEFACIEISRLQQQQPDYGPVLLLCADGDIVQVSNEPYNITALYCRWHINNDAAIAEACRLGRNPLYGDLLVFAEDGSIVWDSHELRVECARRQSTTPADPPGAG